MHIWNWNRKLFQENDIAYRSVSIGIGYFRGGQVNIKAQISKI